MVALGALTAGIGLAVLTRAPVGQVAGSSPTPGVSVATTTSEAGSGSSSPSASASASATASPTGPGSASPTPSPTQAASAAPAGSWVAAAEMMDYRWDASATRLRDGSVLVAGGFYTGEGNASCNRSAERYDPGADRWMDVTFLPEARCAHSATLLRDGRVLVAGGFHELPAVLATAWIYDPGTDRWTAVAPMAAGRRNHAAILLGNGQVLVVGGLDATGAALASAEVFDPATGSWSSAGGLSEGRAGIVLEVLADGRALVAGGEGGQRGTTATASADIYDPTTRRWQPTARMTVARAYAGSIRLGSGIVLVFGGHTGSRFDTWTNTAELFDPRSGSWTATGSMSFASSRGRAATLANGDVLAVGGMGGPIAPVERFEVSAGVWRFDASPIQARFGASLIGLDGGTILMIGGSTADGVLLRSAERYVPHKP